jgi:tetratricopeptide (TPR) repeat protein
MSADAGRPTGGKTDQQGSRTIAHCIAGAALALLLFAAAVSCKLAVVHVRVSDEDIMRANTVASEGDIAFARKDYYAALIKYLEAGRLNPNSEYIFNKMGITYSRLRFYTQAIAAFNHSIGLNPKFSYSYNNIGSVYFAENNKRKAESCFRKAISLKNDEASFHINLGTLLFEKKDYEKGLQELRKGLTLDPDIMRRTENASLVAAVSQQNTAEKNYFMARFYASMGNVDRAVENLQQALANGFTNLEALRTEKDFDPIRQDEKFIAFMKYAAQVIKS